MQRSWMKSRFLIGLSAVALMVLIGIQYISITDTYRTKKDQFDTKFGGLVREGMEAFNDLDYHFGLDSVLFLLDNLAVDYLFSNPDTLQIPPAVAFHRILRNYREPEYFLGEYIRKAGEEPLFNYYLQINELYLIDMDFRQQVYSDSLLIPMVPPEALLASSNTYTRNFFQISYAVYVNFTNRSSLILQEMRSILSLSILTLLLVFSVFYITLRNLLIQKRLSEMKSDFINNMTHELKTPLSTISVASSSLGEHSIIRQQNKVEELSDIIKKQNRHLSELIDRILDINIWEKDQVRLRPVRVNTEEWIRELVDTFVLEQKELPLIELHIELAAKNHELDQVHMSTVMNNLLSNAVKYGSVPCRIRIEIGDREGDLVITVTDNGPGIRKEELKHVFEKFYRGLESRQRVIKGLGLGLYYVKQIVEAHGGRISVRNAPGEGAQFRIIIPFENGHTSG